MHFQESNITPPLPGEKDLSKIVEILRILVEDHNRKIDSSKIDSSAITIADGAITTAKLADGAVTTPKLNDPSATNSSATTDLAAFSSANSSWTDITGATRTITTSDARGVLVIYSGAMLNNTAGEAVGVAVLADGTSLNQYYGHSSNSSERTPFCVVGWHDSPSDGSHTYKAQMVVNAGTATFTRESIGGRTVGATLIAIEIRR